MGKSSSHPETQPVAHACSCATGCATKRCGCHKHNALCSALCACAEHGNCVNTGPKPKLSRKPKPKPKPEPKPARGGAGGNAGASAQHRTRAVVSGGGGRHPTQDSTGFVCVFETCGHVNPTPGTYTRTTLGVLLRTWRTFVNTLEKPYKIGITDHPVRRSWDKWSDDTTYRDRYKGGHMHVLGKFGTGEGAGMAEAALIAIFHDHALCRNKLWGDDGRREASIYLYVVTSQAS